MALTWCKPTLNEKAGHDAIAASAERAHSHGIRFLFDIDIRPARDEFFRRYPTRRLGIVQPIELTLDQHGKASGDTSTGKSADHYGSYEPVGFRLLRAYSYDATDGGYDALEDVTPACTAELLEPGRARASLDCGPEQAGKHAIVFTVFEYSYPDIFCEDLLSFHAELLESYADVPLDGATIDEWGAFPYPGFDFSGAWRRPWYSDSLVQLHHEHTGRDIILDYLNTRIPPADDPGAQVRAINDFYDLLRARNVEIERCFYDSVKRIWGQDAFVGVHPTWFAIEETANTPEIWKNGLDWWDVRRDFGQTDEIAIYPVRLALAHKWGGAVFYNMWYNMGSSDVSRYWLEAWENLRWGGRTHTLGYECRAETPGVMELSPPGLLESVSRIEELVGLANLFQRSAAKSNVAVVIGYPAAVNWTCNVEDGVHWNMNKGVFPTAFAVARDLFTAGWVCDLIPSYEIGDGDLRFEDGKARYGSETYDALVFIRPEFSTRSTLSFLALLGKADYPLAIIGHCERDSRGECAKEDCELAAGLSRLHISGPGSGQLIAALYDWGIERNDIQDGCRLQDGSVIICNRGRVHRGNPLAYGNLLVNGHRVDVQCEDAFGIALTPDGRIDRFFGGKVKLIRVDGRVVFRNTDPRDMYAERSGDGYRIAVPRGRDVAWHDTDDLGNWRPEG